MTLIIILVNIGISLMAFQNPFWIEKYKFNPYRMKMYGEHYRWISHGFVHANWTHLAFNMISLYFFGSYCEQIFQPSFVFIFFYLIAIVVSSIPDYFKNLNNPYYGAIGASGAVSAVIFSMVLFAPWSTIYVYFFPLYFILYAILYVFYSYYMSKNGGDNIGHMAHLSGAIFGIVATVIYRPESIAIFLSQIGHPPFLN